MMMTDATAGVSERNQERLSMLDAIAGDVEEPVVEGEIVEEQPIEEVEVVADPEPIPEPEPESVKPATIRLKIDGEEREVSQDELIEYGKRAMQKELAADKRLEEATRLLNEARQQTTPQPSKDAAPTVDAGMVKAIQYGTEEEAAQALSDLMGRGKATPEQIDNVVSQKVAAILTQKEISTRFTTEFAEIAQDDDLYGIAAMKVQRRLDAGEPNTWDTYAAVGKELSEKYGKPKEPEVPQTMEEKQAKKSTVTVIKSASAKPAGPKEDKPETVADVLQEMRKARHQT
jgi:hypothetical protein